MSENKQDTITVELPIEADGPEYVRASSMSLSRANWREAASGKGEWNNLVHQVAPAVVAWIERDEWKPLDLPAVGRTIKATLRDGSVETFKVDETEDTPAWVAVWKADSDDAARYIHRTLGVYDPGFRDIIAWEYVDEPAVDLAAIADRIAAAVNELREAIG